MMANPSPHCFLPLKHLQNPQPTGHPLCSTSRLLPEALLERPVHLLPLLFPPSSLPPGPPPSPPPSLPPAAPATSWVAAAHNHHHTPLSSYPPTHPHPLPSSLSHRCTSDLLGGSCVGTVVDLSGDAATTNPAGAALVGYPCLDVTPSDKTLSADGTLSSSGEYVAKLWSVCDCQAPAVMGEPVLPLPKVGKLNFTDIKSLVDILKPGADGSNPLQAVMDVVKSKIPPLVVPDVNPKNLTNALGLIGSLVGKGMDGSDSSSGATAVKAIADLVKGASVVAAAANSTNPLGTLLGALAPKSEEGSTNPLAGLGNLVSALAPQGADTTEKSDILNSILGALQGGTSAAPHADLLAAVSRILSGAGGESPIGDLTGLISKFKGANITDIGKTLMGAINQGKEAAAGQVDLAGILSKAQQFVGGLKGGATDGSGNPTLGAILSGVQALANGHNGAAGDVSSNPLAFLGGLLNKAGGAGTGGGGATLQTLLDVATKAGPVLQQLQGLAGGAPGSNPFSGIVKAITGGEGGEGLDLASLTHLASKVGPVLQALGGGTGGGAATPGGDPLSAILGVLGGGAGGNGQLNLEQIKGLFSMAKKAAPVLQAITKASGGANSGLSGLQAFLDKIPQMAGRTATV